MGKHRSRWDLTPTVIGGLFVLSAGIGVALGPSFVRPSVEFGPSVVSLAVGGGQAVGAVEVPPLTPAPAKGARPVSEHTHTGRALPSPVTVRRSHRSPDPVAETVEPTEAARTFPPPADEPEPAPSPVAEDAEAYEPPCAGWSK